MYKLMIKTHNKTGLKYLCITQKENWKEYLGSGKKWREHLKKNGNNISTELIFESKDYLEFTAVCKETSKRLNVVLSEEFANLIPEVGYARPGDITPLLAYWKYISDERKIEIYKKRGEQIKNNHWTKNLEKSPQIIKGLSEKAIERWTFLSIDERREIVNRMHEGFKNFAKDKDSDRYKNWANNISESVKKALANTPFNILSEKNRNARLNTSTESKERRKKKIQEVWASGIHDHIFKRYSEERQGLGNPACRKIFWHGTIYPKLEFEKLFGKLTEKHIQEEFAKQTDCKILFDDIQYEIMSCPHCGKTTDKKPSSFKRWHFDNCKHKGIS
jgi:hypothetical protein